MIQQGLLIKKGRMKKEERIAAARKINEIIDYFKDYFDDWQVNGINPELMNLFPIHRAKPTICPGCGNQARYSWRHRLTAGASTCRSCLEKGVTTFYNADLAYGIFWFKGDFLHYPDIVSTPSNQETFAYLTLVEFISKELIDGKPFKEAQESRMFREDPVDLNPF